MKMENYFLPRMGLIASFPRPQPLLAAVITNFVFPISLHVDTSSIHQFLFQDFVCFALVPPWPLLWLATKVVITPFPPSLSVEFHT